LFERLFCLGGRCVALHFNQATTTTGVQQAAPESALSGFHSAHANGTLGFHQKISQTRDNINESLVYQRCFRSRLLHFGDGISG
jgi:hypothetical protein